MSSDGSVTHWILQLKAGEAEAAEKLWGRYFHRLVGLARSRLRSRRHLDDEEDVALSAFASFCRAAEQGRFPRLNDRDNLWALLIVITSRKAADAIRYESRRPPGAGPDGLEQVIAREPTPEFAAEVADELGRLLAALGDEELRAIALWKMEAYTDDEIADRIGRARPTVERRLRLIRRLWEEEGRP